MKDQAEALRRRLSNMSKLRKMKALAVVSGKGGVGKSNFSLNFAISLCRKGNKVLLFDMDVGMGNIDILLGKSSRYTIVDFFDKKESLNNVVMEGPENLHYIAGGTGLNRLFKLDKDMIEEFTEEFSAVLNAYDYVIFDMGAGVTEETLQLILSVDEIILVTTPEPTSITDGYAMLKHIHMQNEKVPFLVVVNRTIEKNDGLTTFNRLNSVTKKFLGRELKLLGMIPDDKSVRIAVANQTPFVLTTKSLTAKALVELTERYEQDNFNEIQSSNALQFVSKLKRFLFER
ncbi:MinD/ParA family protein [Robertmurraya sp. DFI.2.37]|uniref:MinD/ParA family protein n=1 Tax=Robertmurraya sp. DFI.2.37 TaxID=3031819 RepID=UPI001243DD77|nr:MinD/ParA family protein [Robertmurraya sp. DFI.2.37]MDF1506569.1 MinD/ParA family protein [Robertmurraya sp. DFI.2.37]